MLSYEEMNQRRITELGGEMTTLARSSLQPTRHVGHDVRANIASTLARYYSELSHLDNDSFEKFSVARLLRSRLERMPLTGREAEICEAAALIFGQNHDSDRNWIPFPAIGLRAMATIPGSKGGYLVGASILSLIDTPLAWSVAQSAGAMILIGLRDQVLIPRTVIAPTVTWIGENSTAPSESPPTFGNISLIPKTALVLVKFSAQLLRQGEAVEPTLREILRRAVREALDVAFLNGAGGVMPLGLQQTAGIGTQSGTSLAHAGILTMRQKVLTAGAQETNLAWIGTPGIQELLGARERATGGGRFMWDSDGVLGRPAYATKNAPANALTCGDFGQAVVAIFGPGIKIEIDPSQDFNTNGLVARVMLMVDVAFPNPAAFCVASSVT